MSQHKEKDKEPPNSSGLLLQYYRGKEEEF